MSDSGIFLLKDAEVPFTLAQANPDMLNDVSSANTDMLTDWCWGTNRLERITVNVSVS